MTPLTELIFISKDLCCSCQLHCGPKKALHFQKQSKTSESHFQWNFKIQSLKPVCSTYLTLEVEYLVMFHVARREHIVLDAFWLCFAMDVLKWGLLFPDKHVDFQPISVLFLQVSERPLSARLDSWGWISSLRVFTVAASWILILRIHYTFKAK